MIEAIDLAKAYGRDRVLEGVSFRVVRGEALFVLGPSGAGKSTLLRCLNGLVEPTGGSVKIDGAQVTRVSLREVRRRIGFIFQGFNVIENLTVLQNVLVGRLAEKPPWGLVFGKADREIALEAIDAVGVTEKARERVGTLSGGQKQRVGIARALAHRPEVLLADEPVSSLDPVTGREILALLGRINRERGTTLICNLHDVEQARERADRVLGLREGTVRYLGPPEGLSADVLARIYGERSPMPSPSREPIEVIS